MREIENNYNLDIKFTIDGTVFTVLFIKESLFMTPMPKHSHGKNSYELHYIAGGKGTLLTNEATYDLTSNSLFTTGPFVEHEQLSDKDDPMKEWCIYIKTGASGTSDIAAEFCRTHFWIGNDSHDVSLIFREMLNELSRREIGYRANLESLLRQFIVAMVRNYKSSNVNTEGDVSPLIDNSRFLIVEEYFLYNYDSLSLPALAKLLGLSRRQTERVLMTYYGKSFSAKKQEARMSAATTLLADRSRSIADIATELGYSSAGYFSDAFKAYYNVTPAAWRKK